MSSPSDEAKARALPDEREMDGDGEEEMEVDDVEEDAPSDADTCCICQDAIAMTEQGCLPDCVHRFHVPCILMWARVTNLCPLCKTKFNFVVKKDEHGNLVEQQSVADCRQVFRPEPADHDIAAQLRLVNTIRCEMCGRGDDEHVLLLCEARGCTYGCHTYCIGLNEVPNQAWFCARHESGPARATDLVPRPASTLSSRRRTRRLASLMSNAFASTSASSGDSEHARRLRRLRVSDAQTLDTARTRPLRGISLSYALRMSQELQAVQRRADAMFARGDLSESVLFGSSSGGRTRSTPAATAPSNRPSSELSRHLYGTPSPLAPSFAAEYGELHKLMVDAASHDNYASTVSLAIPETARLRLVPQVKAFFVKLNGREKRCALESGCLSVLHSWVRPAEGQQISRFHSQVLDGVLSALELLPLRKEDLDEHSEFRDTLKGLLNRSDVEVALRERAAAIIDTWNEIAPLQQIVSPSVMAPSADQSSVQHQAPLLPRIASFSSPSTKKKRSKSDGNAHEPWKHAAVDYVKAKLYPLYKQSAGKISKDLFKTIVKQVVSHFGEDARVMQSRVIDERGELSTLAKTRLKKLLDQIYHSKKHQTLSAASELATHPHCHRTRPASTQ